MNDGDGRKGTGCRHAFMRKADCTSALSTTRCSAAPKRGLGIAPKKDAAPGKSVGNMCSAAFQQQREPILLPYLYLPARFTSRQSFCYQARQARQARDVSSHPPLTIPPAIPPALRLVYKHKLVSDNPYEQIRLGKGSHDTQKPSEKVVTTISPHQETRRRPGTITTRYHTYYRLSPRSDSRQPFLNTGQRSQVT